MVKYENTRFENYQNGTDMTFGMEDFFSDYNTQRRHSSLGDETPEKIHKGGLAGISNREQR